MVSGAINVILYLISAGANHIPHAKTSNRQRVNASTVTCAHMYFLQFPSHFIFIYWIPLLFQVSLGARVPPIATRQQGLWHHPSLSGVGRRTLPASPPPSVSSARVTAASSLVCPRRYGHGDSTDCGSGAIMKYVRPKRLVLVLIPRLWEGSAQRCGGRDSAGFKPARFQQNTFS